MASAVFLPIPIWAAATSRLRRLCAMLGLSPAIRSLSAAYACALASKVGGGAGAAAKDGGLAWGAGRNSDLARARTLANRKTVGLLGRYFGVAHLACLKLDQLRRGPKREPDIHGATVAGNLLDLSGQSLVRAAQNEQAAAHTYIFLQPTPAIACRFDLALMSAHLLLGHRPDYLDRRDARNGWNERSAPVRVLHEQVVCLRQLHYVFSGYAECGPKASRVVLPCRLRGEYDLNGEPLAFFRRHEHEMVARSSPWRRWARRC